MVLIIISHNFFAQTPLLNQEKYWLYRTNLDYFRVIGLEEGESLVADIRNKYDGNASGGISFGDGMIRQGWYLGVLGTEVFLLKKNQNQKVFEKTIKELYYALKAVERLDLSGEKIEKYSRFQSQKNGFFARSDACLNANFIEKNYHKLNGATAHYLRGDRVRRPDYMDDVKVLDCSKNNSLSVDYQMSQDQLYHLIMGLAFVFKFSDYTIETVINGKKIEYNPAKHAQEIFKTIWQKLEKDKWAIKNPEGKKVTFDKHKSGRTIMYRAAFEKTAQFFNIEIKKSPGKFIPSITWQQWHMFASFPANLKASNLHMALVCAAVSDSWKTISGKNNTLMSLYKLSKHHGWETFYPLLNAVLYDKKMPVKGYNKSVVEAINKAPLINPQNHKGTTTADGGWASTLKYLHTKIEQEAVYSSKADEGANAGIYPGLDYMLLYNLYSIFYNL